jgi:hypothetical protein
MPSNAWNDFRRIHKGSGKSMKELSVAYRNKQEKEDESPLEALFAALIPDSLEPQPQQHKKQKKQKKQKTQKKQKKQQQEDNSPLASFFETIIPDEMEPKTQVSAFGSSVQKSKKAPSGGFF